MNSATGTKRRRRISEEDAALIADHVTRDAGGVAGSGSSLCGDLRARAYAKHGFATMLVRLRVTRAPRVFPFVAETRNAVSTQEPSPSGNSCQSTTLLSAIEVKKQASRWHLCATAPSQASPSTSP